MCVYVYYYAPAMAGCGSESWDVYMIVPCACILFQSPPSLLSTPSPPSPLSSQWDLYYKGGELYHALQWKEMVEAIESSLLKLPGALQQCKDECYEPMRLGRGMGFAQVLEVQQFGKRL